MSYDNPTKTEKRGRKPVVKQAIQTHYGQDLKQVFENEFKGLTCRQVCDKMSSDLGKTISAPALSYIAKKVNYEFPKKTKTERQEHEPATECK